MSRLSMDNLIGPTRMEPDRSTASPLDLIATEKTSFDDHFRHAATEASDARREPRADAPDAASTKSQRDSNNVDDDAKANTKASEEDQGVENTPTEKEDIRDEKIAGEGENGETADEETDESEVVAAILSTEINVISTDAPIVVPESVDLATTVEVSQPNAVQEILDGVTQSGEAATAETSTTGNALDAATEVIATKEGDAAMTLPPAVETTENAATAADAELASLDAESQTAASAAVDGDGQIVASAQPQESPDAEKPKKVKKRDDAGIEIEEADVPKNASVDKTNATKTETTMAVDATSKIDADPVDSTTKPATNAAQTDPLGPSRAAPDRAAPPANATPTADGMSPDDRVRFVERVSGAFRAAGNGDGTVRMRLHPAELGSLQLEITTRDGALTARLQTDTSETRTLLLDNLPALRERLAQQDIKIERFEVIYQNGSGGESPTGAEDQSSRQGHSRGRSSNAADGAESDSSRPAPSRRVSWGGGSQLDVTV